MAPTIDLAFIEQYNADVHLLYRQWGSRLQNMTRKGTVMATKVHWQKFGHLTAETRTEAGRARNGIHNFQDPAHSNVQADMADYFVPTLIEKLDMLKLNIDEKNAHVRAQVAALGQRIDSVLLSAMGGGANATDLGGGTPAAWDYDTFMNVVTTFQVAEVPDDGRRYCALHPYAWSQAAKVPEFANADYVGQAQLPFAGGMTAKSWMGIMWFVLPNIAWATDIATNFAWHQDAMGHGVNSEIETNWDWENDRSAWSCVSMMSMGGEVIDDTGVYKVSTSSPKPIA